MVTGTGRIRVAPDKVCFSVGVATEAASVTQALRENNRKAEAVISALKTAGVRPEEIQTSGLRIRRRDEDVSLRIRMYAHVPATSQPCPARLWGT